MASARDRENAEIDRRYQVLMGQMRERAAQDAEALGIDVTWRRLLEDEANGGEDEEGER
jgi:hypothetical protein